VAALEAELQGRMSEFAAFLSAQVPTHSPPPLYDDDWRQRVLRKLRASPEDERWWVSLFSAPDGI